MPQLASEYAGPVMDDMSGTTGVDTFGMQDDIEDEAIRRRRVTDEAERIEGVIVAHCLREYEDSKSAMSDNIERWDRYWKMYFNDFVPTQDDSPYQKVNIPLLSRNIKLLYANLSKMTIPDKQRMDFFRAVPKRTGADLSSNPIITEHARQSEYAVQQNLVDSNFATEYGYGLLDFCVTGQMWALMCWDQKVKIEEKLIPNPAYNSDDPQANVVWGADGIKELVEPYIWDIEEYRSYDAPKVRYLDARNVFPSEMDRNNGAECYGVSIYDTTTIVELEQNSIADGGQLYANLDKLKPGDEKRDTPEIDETSSDVSYGSTTRKTASNPGANVPKLKRITRFGRLEKSHLFPDETVDADAWSMFCEKFGIDKKRARYCKTWVCEIVNNKTGVRIQPLPYKRDEIPLVHHRLFWKPNLTLGEGFYKLDEYEERIYNFFNRKGLELTQKVVSPPIAVNENAFDPIWFQQNGNRFVYKPDMLVKMRQTNNVRDGFNPMQYDSNPLQEIRALKSQSNNNLNALSHLPAIKQGIAGESDSATEAGIVAASSDLIMDETAEGIEEGFLKPCVQWNYSLEQQYRIEPQIVSRLDNAGRDADPIEIPPEVWINNYAINIVGRRTIGNKAVQQMAFKEFVTAWMPEGIINKKEAFIRHAKLLDMVDAEALYMEPEPPQGPPPPKVAISARVDLNELPPQYQDAILAENFPGVKDEDGAPFGDVWPAQHLHEFPGEVIDSGGQQSAPSDSPDRNHHAQGEVEKRQRGLKDAEGITRSLAQQTRDPSAGRRFT